jgi:ribonuclease HI
VAAKGQATSSNPLTKQGNTRWRKPPRGFMKFNWDASVDHSGKRMGVGLIARDDKGEFCAAVVSSMPFICDPKVAEAMAAWRAFVLCEEIGVHRAVLEGDSLNVVKAINSSEACWRPCGMKIEAM